MRRGLNGEEETARHRLWLLGHSWQSIANVRGVSQQAIQQWGRARGLAPNRGRGLPERLERGPIRGAVKRFRSARVRCELEGVPAEQLDALEPFRRDLGEPDPAPRLTGVQRAALLDLADAHDAVLRAIHPETPARDSQESA